LEYRIEVGRVMLNRHVDEPANDPFRTFDEWHSEADVQAYARLKGQYGLFGLLILGPFSAITTRKQPVGQGPRSGPDAGVSSGRRADKRFQPEQ
jgi:hypothetical protein